MRGLILGFDGVLVHERPVQAEVLLQILGEVDREISSEQARVFLEGRGSATEDQSLIARALEESRGTSAAAKSETGIDPSLAPRLAVRMAAYYRARIKNEGHRPVDGAQELVKEAHDRGWMLALISPSPELEIESALEQFGIRDRFKTVVSGSPVSASAYQEIWRQLNSLPPLPSRLLHPHEVLALDAAPQALEAAAQAGFSTVGLTTRHSAEILDAAERIIDHPGDVLANPLDTLK